MDRRSFLKLLGLGATATAAGLVLPEVESVRRYWAVPRNAPVPSKMPYVGDDDWLFGAEPSAYPDWRTQELSTRFTLDPYRAVVRYEAAERIPPGALVALGPDGKAYVARSVTERPIIGPAISYGWQVSMADGERQIVDVDVPLPTVWSVRA